MQSPNESTSDEYHVVWTSENPAEEQRSNTSRSSSRSADHERPLSPGSLALTNSTNAVTRMTHRNIRHNWHLPNDGVHSTEQGMPRFDQVLSASVPAARFGHTSVAFRDRMITFGGRDGEHFFNDVWCYDVGRHVWEEEWRCQGGVISPRCGHTASIVDDSLMVVVGGCVGVAGNACVGDVWLLDLESRTWQSVEAAARTPAHSYSNLLRGAVDANQGPSRREFGALRPSRLVDPNHYATTWNPVLGGCLSLPPRKGHTAVTVEKSLLLVFGGTCGVPNRDDAHVWCLDLHQPRQASWKVLSTVGQAPEPRMYHVAELTERHSMLVFGGKLRNQQFSNDLFELTFVSPLQQSLSDVSPHSPMSSPRPIVGPAGVWRRIDVSSSIRPCARMCSSSVYLNGILCIFLGGSECYHDDSYEFDFSTLEWRMLPNAVEGLAGLPPCTRPTTVRHGNTITFFGGCTLQNVFMNTVMQLGLESPSLKELCREWVRQRSNLLSSQQTPVSTRSQSTGQTQQTFSFQDSQQQQSLQEVLPDALQDYLDHSD